MPTPSYLARQQIIQSAGVRAVLDQVRDRIDHTVQTLARAEKTPVETVRSSGTRPLGRPYSRLTIPADLETGGAQRNPKRLLSRGVTAL